MRGVKFIHFLYQSWVPKQFFLFLNAFLLIYILFLVKYEQGEKKRREERLERARQYMKEKESEHSNKPKSLRKETWVRPDGGQRVHRTTQAVQKEEDSEEENLLLLSYVEVGYFRTKN